jgi:hypothetical protein
MLARPAAGILTCWLLAPVSLKKGLGEKKAFSCQTERKKMTQQSTIQSGGFFIISAAFLSAPLKMRMPRKDDR